MLRRESAMANTMSTFLIHLIKARTQNKWEEKPAIRENQRFLQKTHLCYGSRKGRWRSMAKRDPFTKETRERNTSCLKSEKMENWEILHQLKRLYHKFTKPCSWGNGPHCIFNEPISLGRSLHLRIPEEVHLAVYSTVDCAVTSTYNRCNFIANPQEDKRTGSPYVY